MVPPREEGHVQKRKSAALRQSVILKRGILCARGRGRAYDGAERGFILPYIILQLCICLGAVGYYCGVALFCPMGGKLRRKAACAPQTNNMFSDAEFAAMKEGAFLINAARGSVVDIEALRRALDSGRVAGAALDVFPREPADKSEEFVSPLRGLDNVLITPHIGGSTQEAQANIGLEVAERLVKYSDNGSTLGAVNCVEVSLPVQESGKVTRFMHIHKNVPGVLASINKVFSSHGLNVSGQYLRTDGEYGYVVVDIDGHASDAAALRTELAAIDGTLKVRYLL